MKLSEAMRIGASQTRKCRDKYINRTGTATCAIGAALYAHGYRTEEAVTGADVSELLGVGYNPIYTNPVTGDSVRSLFDVITDLNDEQDWSRKRIAKWLEEQGL